MMQINKYCLEDKKRLFDYINSSNVNALFKEYSFNNCNNFYKMIEDINNKNNSICFIAIENNSVIGYIVGVIEQKDNQKNMIGIVYSLFGDNDMVLSKLMDNIETYFKNKSCTFIEYHIPSLQKKELEKLGQKGFKPYKVELMKKI